MFINVFTTAYHVITSWIKQIQSTSWRHFSIILPSPPRFLTAYRQAVQKNKHGFTTGRYLAHNLRCSQFCKLTNCAIMIQWIASMEYYRAYCSTIQTLLINNTILHYVCMYVYIYICMYVCMYANTLTQKNGQHVLYETWQPDCICLFNDTFSSSGHEAIKSRLSLENAYHHLVHNILCSSLLSKI
jgi:hypothetical protein